ncbi:CocE/NonD family hydrolase [Brevibacterium sp.]|uniref:CocE/NonD family hydrolase n=1 Tax=Brevibacterium sp. TaxID=1701 RepID=UPI0028116D98|nr:CocE/NonD family hydrolase [Brevibacterium sp.]
MKEVEEFPYEVRTVENVFITMRDGARLAARLWIPIEALSEPMPAVLEYIPYRKRDNSRGRDTLNMPYIAGHGYVCARVDLRGSGDSDGVLVDEYCPAELEDAEDVIAWLAEQEWCDGSVGMMGISWGGFNSLQVAARRPPALGAIISASATDDLYVDNMHYMGGALLSDNLSEATVMFAFNSLPPDPEIVGDRWRDMWIERLEDSGLWIEKWLSHQRRDEYWRSASVSEDYSAIDCPVMAVGGWADGYTNAIFRLMENLEVPRKGLIGPWGHKYPHLGVPGPDIGFLQEVIRWFDHWLKDEDTGIMDEPMLRLWMQDSVSPKSSYEERPGRWIEEDQWPSPRIESRTLQLGDRHLIPVAEADAAAGDPPRPDADQVQGDEVQGEQSLKSPLSVGMFAGKWASYAAAPDLPFDQREEDGGALTFDTDVLEEDVAICGRGECSFVVSSDKPVAMLIVRLSDILPDGEATRVTYGILNLTHRGGSENPEPLEPGRKYRVRIPLNGIAQVFPAGHRIRLSVSTSYWPLVWPSPEAATVTLTPELSTLTLPVRRLVPADDEITGFEEAEAAPELEVTPVETGDHQWRVIRDLATNVSTLEIINDQGSFRIDETGAVIRRKTDEWYSFRWNEVNSTRGETRTIRRIERGDWGVEVHTRTVLTSTPADFHITAELDAYELEEGLGYTRVHSENWHREIPRDLL